MGFKKTTVALFKFFFGNMQQAVKVPILKSEWEILNHRGPEEKILEPINFIPV